jgi:hypothetical protein
MEIKIIIIPLFVKAIYKIELIELIFLIENIFKDDINNFFTSSKFMAFKK